MSILLVRGSASEEMMHVRFFYIVSEFEMHNCLKIWRNLYEKMARKIRNFKAFQFVFNGRNLYIFQK